MLTTSPTASIPGGSRKESRLWHVGNRHTLPLGCTICPDIALCGGLQIASAVFDCLHLCRRYTEKCGEICHCDPQKCDAVCRQKPLDFVQRVREISGFPLDNVPRAKILAPPDLPPLVPIIYHGSKRNSAFSGSSIVCLPLYSLVCRAGGRIKYSSAQDLTEGYRLARETRIMLTGIAEDPPLERWWSLGEDRRKVIRALIDIGITMVTTPNFSLFTDQPRWDDMHSMKRIAIVHEEFLREGLPAALHVNARTEKDWERWSEYISSRPEVTHIAYEFGTGAGWRRRIDWHVEQLTALARAVGHPLHLVLRGGSRVVPFLEKHFAGLTFLDTSMFMKTMKRRRAKLTLEREVEWYSCRTDEGQMLESLLAHNWRVVLAASRIGKSRAPLPVLEAAG